MTAHQQFAEDLALYAMGSLPAGEEHRALEAHLQTCGPCREELMQLRGDMGLLSLSTIGPAPPERSRLRLMSAIAREPRAAATEPVFQRSVEPMVARRSEIEADTGRRVERTAPPRRWWAMAPWAVAAAFLMVAVVLWKQAANLQQQLAGLQSVYSNQQEELTRARELVATLDAPESQQVTLVAVKALPQPHGKAFYRRSTGSLIFLASNLPALTADKVYELWLIPNAGSPVAAGVFRPDAHGSAAVLNPPLYNGLEAKTFVVTLEPAGGSHEAPRGTPVIVGVGE